MIVMEIFQFDVVDICKIFLAIQEKLTNLDTLYLIFLIVSHNLKVCDFEAEEITNFFIVEEKKKFLILF